MQTHTQPNNTIPMTNSAVAAVRHSGGIALLMAQE